MSQATFSGYDRLSKFTSMTIGASAAADEGDVQDLADAIEAIIYIADLRAVRTTVIVDNEGSALPASNANADRGKKWLFRTQDTGTGIIHTNEIGTQNPAVLASPTDDYIDLTTGVGATLKAAWEIVYESNVGNPGVLLSVQQVTRTD